MKTAKKLRYISQALTLQEIHISALDLSQVLDTAALVSRKKGNTALRDISQLQARYNALRKAQNERKNG